MAPCQDAGDYVALYRLYQPRIYRYCLRMLGNRCDAEDAAQETFVRLSRQLDRVVGDPGPYISGIAHHVCYDLRHKRRGQSVSLDEAFDRPARQMDPEREIVDGSFLTEMWDALSERERVLLAHAFAGFSYDEIALRAAISAKCVSVSISRARQRLRRLAAAGVGAAAIPGLIWRTLRRARQHVSTVSSNGLATVAQLVDQGTLIVASLVASLLTGAGMLNAASPSPSGAALRTAPPRQITAVASALRLAATPGTSPAVQAVLHRSSPDGRPPAATPPAPPILRQAGAVLPGGDAGPDDGTYQSIVASPNFSSDHTVFASQWTANNCTQCASLLRSSDGGSTWVHVSSVGFTGGEILLPPAFPQDPTIFAAGPEGLFRSADGGSTFTPALPLPSTTAVIVPSSGTTDAQVLVLPQNQTGPTWVYEEASGRVSVGPSLPPGFAPDTAAYVQNSLLIAGRPASSSAIPGSQLVLCAPTCAVVADLPGELPPFHVAVSPAVATDHTVAVASYTHLYISHDGGATFHAEVPSTADAFTDVTWRPGGLLVLSAFTTALPRQAVVLQSSDGGSTFTSSTAGLAHLTSLTPLVALPDARLIGAIVSDGTGPLYGLRCSTDGGADWGGC